jgi:hypothetical protein
VRYVPALAMQALHDDFGVRHECFASPLNAELASFGSLFPDVDSFFGSTGSFFDYFPHTGSFQCHPPADHAAVERTLAHVAELLLTASAVESATRQAAAAGAAAASEEETNAGKEGGGDGGVGGDLAAGCALEQPLGFILILPAGFGPGSGGGDDGAHLAALRRAWAPLVPFLRRECTLHDSGAGGHGDRPDAHQSTKAGRRNSTPSGVAPHVANVHARCPPL